MQKIFSIIAVITLCNVLVHADETPWPVPDDEQGKVAPFVFDDNSVKNGEGIYNKNCKSCHGDVGEMNMIPLNPLPHISATDASAFIIFILKSDFEDD